MSLFGVMAASGGGTTSSVVSFADWKPVLDALTAQISSDTLISVLAGTITAAIGLVFAWWGVRKLVRTLMSAFRKGRMSVG